jgi:hypothetical protein
MPKKRAESTQTVLKKMHIYCEGAKTEPNYLNSYIEDKFGDKLRDVVIVEDAKTNTPVQLVKEAIKEKNSGNHPEGDIYWVVYDRESKAKYKDSLHDSAFDLARGNNILIALSNVCFEHWLILHFIDSDASYVCFDDLISKSCLKSTIRKLTGKNYEKGSVDIFSLVKEGVTLARRRANSINKRTKDAAPANAVRPHHLNPYTDLPLLLDAIDSFEPGAAS